MAEEIEVVRDDGEADELTAKLKEWFRHDIKHTLEWRKEAREDFEFYAGDQWSRDDIDALKAKNRPAMTFNRVAPLVNAVVGSEINNRREVQYIPREMGDAQANELLSSAAEWFRDQTEAEDEESDAFEDAVISGMGWTDTSLDFEEDPDGAPKVRRLNCLKMAWDCNAVKPNLQDAERLWYVDEMPYSKAREMFPDAPKEMLHAGWAKTLESDPTDPHDQDAADRYTGEQNEYVDHAQGRTTNCTIVECRWFEREVYYRGPDMMTGEPREYDERQVKLIRKDFPDFPVVRQTRKVVRRAFIGREVLGQPDKPLVPPGMFGWECVTGYRNKIKGQFYGIIRAAKDPQRWSNKYFSQVMFLLNSQSKGGIGAERGAFEDDNQAELSWAKADEITWFTKGALSGSAPKFIPKPQANFPAGFFTLFQESKEAISQVTGLSQEFLGTREVDQAGVLEYQRRQSSLNLLASLFNSLRRYRKRQGKVMLFLIQNHLSDGRLIRIVGEDKKEYVPLTKAAIADKAYDIIVDDAPNSPNEKERTWQIIMQMLPMMKDFMTPESALEVLKYSPLPASLVDRWSKKAMEAQQQAEQNRQPSPEEVKMMAEQQKHQMDMAGKAADLQVDQAKNEMAIQKDSIDLFMKQQEAALDMRVEEQKAAAQLMQIAAKARANDIAQQNANTRRTSSAK